MFSRRHFLRQSALAAAALTAGCAAPVATSKVNGHSRRLNCAQIGCGGRAMPLLDWVVNQSGDNLVAIVDPDESRLAHVLDWLKKQDRDPGSVRVFSDYRVMFDKMHREIDAVTIASPNHHHAPASLLAMQAGIGVYCEKPLSHDVAEARKLRKMAKHYKVATQMGNQGHCQEGYHRLVEFIQAGVIGNVRETYSWTNRANGGTGPRPAIENLPKGMNWDSWIGPAPYRDFHSDLHPHEWHGWHDFGNGSLGNMGTHVLDGVYWALKLEHPSAVEAEEIYGGADERYPLGGRVRWDFPARQGQPPVKVYWYEGLTHGADPALLSSMKAAPTEVQNLPPLLRELKKQYPEEEFDNSGTIYVGDKGIIYTGTYGGRMHVVPWAKMREISAPAKTLRRPGNIMDDFLNAVREGRTNTAAGFDYSARLTEFTLLGNVAQCVGAGERLEWDGPAMRFKNRPDLNRWLDFPHRPGWAI